MNASSAREPVLIPLNRSEHAYIAVGGLIGGILQTYCLRFDQPIEPERMREALRRIVSAYPRMRSRVQPTWLSWRLCILPDDTVVDQLFEASWQVDRGIDAEDFEQLQATTTRLLNTPAAIDRGLPMRAVFVPHASRPALFFSVEHFVGDGRSMMMMIGALMKLLNGQDIPPEPLETSCSMIPAIVPARLLDWPRAVWAARQHARVCRQRLQAGRIAKLDTHDLGTFTTHGVLYHECATPGATLRALAKQLGTSVNTLVMSAICQTVLERAAADPQALAHVRMSVDLRRYFPKGRAPEFGNYVATFYVTEPHQRDIAAHLASIDAQVKEALKRFERHELILPWLPAELPRFMGRKLYGMLARHLRRGDRLPQMSCHLATLGDCTWVNQPDATVKLDGFFPTAPSNTTFIAQTLLNGRLYLTAGWQNDRMTREATLEVTRHIDRILQRYVEQGAAGLVPAGASAAPAPAAAPASVARQRAPA